MGNKDYYRKTLLKSSKKRKSQYATRIMREAKAKKNKVGEDESHSDEKPIEPLPQLLDLGSVLIHDKYTSAVNHENKTGSVNGTSPNNGPTSYSEIEHPKNNNISYINLNTSPNNEPYTYCEIERPDSNNISYINLNTSPNNEPYTYSEIERPDSNNISYINLNTSPNNEPYTYSEIERPDSNNISYINLNTLPNNGQDKCSEIERFNSNNISYIHLNKSPNSGPPLYSEIEHPNNNNISYIHLNISSKNGPCADTESSENKNISCNNFNASSIQNSELRIRQDPDFVIEETNEEEEEILIDGNRIVDFAYFFKQLQEIANHNSPLGCNLSCLKLTKELKKGFLSKFYFTCRMCKIKLVLNNCRKTDNPTDFDLNDNVVSSFMSIGSGFSGLEQVSASLNIPSMCDKLYSKCHTKVCELWELAKEKSMEEAAKEEYDLAILNGDVDMNGVPMITVVADGCWSKRSYRKNYNALSGAAAIIGYRTKKVIYMAVKNKYCMVCARAENKKMSIPDHTCFKNYTGSSSAMESTALVEGFKTSMDTHGLIYSRLIADGDASTYKNIERAKPYGNLLVEKIECTNHLLRNYCTKLDELTRNTSYPLKYRKAVQNNILRLRRSVTGAVKHISAQNNKTFAQKVLELKQDLLNGPHHVFGNHSFCKPYYCQKLNENYGREENLVPIMKCQEGGFIFAAILKFTSRLVNNATSLIHQVNSNIAEVFNSVIAKFIGGKRMNFSGRQSYSGRCAASVVSFNSRQPVSYMSKKVLLRSPNKLVKRLETTKNKKRIQNAKYRIFKTFTPIFKNSSVGSNDKNYGESCEKPDMTEADYNFAKSEHLKNITLSDEDRHLLERRTILQADSIEWRQERRLRLTASIFGKVCKRGLIKCGPLVKNIVTEKNLDHVKSIKHGQSHEHIARNQLEMHLKTPIKPCGLFIDPVLPFLGASPDGLINGDQIVEIKCPYSARGMSVDDGIKEKKIDFWKKDKDGNIVINKKHDWYFQAQGQIHITRRKTCIFAVWTDLDMKVEVIEEDKEFWSKMEEKLKKFYSDCLLPEIIDSRLERHMEIKEPQYIVEAINEKKNKKELKRKINTEIENKPTKRKKAVKVAKQK